MKKILSAKSTDLHNKMPHLYLAKLHLKPTRLQTGVFNRSLADAGFRKLSKFDISSTFTSFSVNSAKNLMPLEMPRFKDFSFQSK